ncbi:NAD(P)-binding domain-containing protein [Ancylobacter defluvii]|nr:NAD(P)-binding domain-containing protein [Ancylobacter defluvii]MBS7589231.1 NAD(P)-binding domain-containing protein [Ancylobacter defluvii]
MLTIGFVGTGTLTEAVVTGLMQSHAGRCHILLSPRSEVVSQRLAAAHEDVRRCASNREVVEGSDVVVLAVLPKQLAEVAAELAFRPEQLVVNCVAGASVEAVKRLVAPAREVVRVVPLPPIRFRQGPIAVYPAHPVVEELFGGLGDLIVAGQESELTAIAHASGMMSSFYAMQNTVIGWLESRGIAGPTAALYMRSLYAGLGALGLDAARKGEPIDPAHHETAGGLNECARRHLSAHGWFDEISAALDAVERHVPSKPRD